MKKIKLDKKSREEFDVLYQYLCSYDFSTQPSLDKAKKMTCLLDAMQITDRRCQVFKDNVTVFMNRFIRHNSQYSYHCSLVHFHYNLAALKIELDKSSPVGEEIQKYQKTTVLPASVFSKQSPVDCLDILGSDPSTVCVDGCGSNAA